jgi:electron transfer flavoprotein alpha subunit
MTAGTNVLVVADGSQGSLTGAGRELLALGRSIADGLEGSVAFLALGVEAAKVAHEAAAAGADRIYDVGDADRAGYHPELFAAVVLAACREWAPRIIVFSHAALGLDLAPRVAFGLGARWATNCVGVTVEAGALRCVRNEVGGKVQVVEAIDGQAVVTLRPKSVDVPPPQPARHAATVAIAAPVATAGDGIRFVERHQEEGGAAAELEQAEVIVTGGLGLGSREAFEKLQMLARALGGALGGSKLAVDRGWISADRQVGATGTTVAPKLYFAVALSGALQHMAGCQKSKIIVAINKDPEAPIFRFARYGVIANWEEVVPELVARLPSAAS